MSTYLFNVMTKFVAKSSTDFIRSRRDFGRDKYRSIMRITYFMLIADCIKRTIAFDSDSSDSYYRPFSISFENTSLPLTITRSISDGIIFTDHFMKIVHALNRTHVHLMPKLLRKKLSPNNVFQVLFLLN